MTSETFCGGRGLVRLGQTDRWTDPLRPFLAFALLVGLAACGSKEPTATTASIPAGASPQMIELVDRYADKHDIPRALMHRVVQRESTYNPNARNASYYGLMQIMPETARTMGYRGAPAGLLDAETNLEYAGRYLRGAWLVANGNHDRAVHWYASGYYYEARNRCMLVETGLRAREVASHCR